jgi:hypothetical protein
VGSIPLRGAGIGAGEKLERICVGTGDGIPFHTAVRCVEAQVFELLRGQSGRAESRKQAHQQRDSQQKGTNAFSGFHKRPPLSVLEQMLSGLLSEARGYISKHNILLWKKEHKPVNLSVLAV